MDFQTDPDVNVVCLARGKQRYLFIFKDSQRSKILRRIGTFANRDDLDFDWADAAKVALKMGKMAGQKRKAEETNQ